MVHDFINKIKWLGHDSFLVQAEKIIYFDPFELKDGPQADLIFVTHDHFDHCSPEDIAKIQGPETIIITEKDSARKLKGDIRVVEPGDSLEVKGVKIQVVPSYNTNKNFHPKKNKWLGFVVEIEGWKVYHAGDTDFIPEMENLEVDIALLPVSGTYVMTAQEAVKAALAIKPKIAIPMHFGAIVGDKNDAETFKAELEGRVDVVVLDKVTI